MNRAAVISVVRPLAILASLVFAGNQTPWRRSESIRDIPARRARRLFRSKDESDIPEGGFEAVFAGLGGYQLVHLAGDERSWINIRFGKKTVDLYSATMEAGGGTFPHKANDVVEWRGVEKNGHSFRRSYLSARRGQ